MKSGRSDKRSESHCDAGPPAGFTVNSDVRAVYFRDVFYDSKSKAGSASFAGPAFIYPVKTFKDSFLLVLGDADAGILDRQEGMFSGSS